MIHSPHRTDFLTFDVLMPFVYIVK